VTIPLIAEAQEGYQEFEGQHDSVWRLKASNGRLIGGYGDNFSYDGSKVVAVPGEAQVLLDVGKDTGTMSVTFTGTINPEKDRTYSGEIKLVYNQFMGTMPFMEGGVADFVILHGDSGQEAPVVPKIRTFLATWGPADLYVNGELVYQGLGGHMMLTERSRDLTTNAIYADAGRTAFYSPMEPSKGYIVAPDEWELHFVAHTFVKDPNNFPGHTVWIHLNFGTVEDLPAPAVLPETGGAQSIGSGLWVALLALGGLALLGLGIGLRRTVSR
ncbi:MAG: hypothetical protein V3S14_10570, partial [Anaerolineae bacterium]